MTDDSILKATIDYTIGTYKNIYIFVKLNNEYFSLPFQKPYYFSFKLTHLYIWKAIGSLIIATVI